MYEYACWRAGVPSIGEVQVSDPIRASGSADEWEDYSVMKKGKTWLSGGRVINLLIVGLVTILMSLSAVEAAGTAVAGATAVRARRCRHRSRSRPLR